MQALLADQLHKSHRRITNQRKLVFEQVKALDFHPTASEVFEAVRPFSPGISLATVYRNLNILRDEGLLREASFERGVVRFDSNLSDHYHFQCATCRRVSDLPGHTKDLERAFSARTGLHISGHHLTFQGICDACRKVAP